MPQSISQELMRLLAAMKASGRKQVWLSETNRAILQNPRAALGGQNSESPPAPAARSHNAAAPPAHTAPAAPPHSAPSPAPAPAPAAPPLALGATDWAALEGLCQSCTRCGLCRTRQRLVFGQGHLRARLMFIGEGPGHEEDVQGRPFVGAAGQLLTRMIAAMGLDRYSEDAAKGVYIANIVKCRPPRNRNPEPGEAEACLPYLRRQIELVQPEAIVLLGAVPLLHLLGIRGITKSRGQWLSYGEIPVMPTFHPALIIRYAASPQLERESKLKVWDDLKKVMALLQLPMPARKQGG